MALDVREPYPEREPRDYTGSATHLLTCDWCGHQAAFRYTEPFGLIRAQVAARTTLGWHLLPRRENEAQRLVCSDVCAAHHPHHRG